MTLHIGAFKTGTSFVQSVLSNNKARLAELGVLWPGESWASQVRAVRGLRNPHGNGYRYWSALVDEINQWQGDSTIVSMESLSQVNSSTVKRVVGTLSDHRVRVVLTARDIGRVLPAQWQESVQNGWTWSYSDYLAGAVERRKEFTRAWEHFWTKQDAPAILRNWGKAVDIPDLCVVTVPPSGAPRGQLWERFCQAVDLRAEQFDANVRVNESLGAASAEVMRYVAIQAQAAGTEGRTTRAIKKSLAKQVMAELRSSEPTLVLPEKFQDWTRNRSEELVSEIRGISPQIVGDLTDLIPTFATPSGPTTDDPSRLPADALLTAAAHGLLGMSDLLTRQSSGRPDESSAE